jgi:hypothetical protein
MPDADPSSSAPVGQGDYVVKAGDCMSSIALDNGFFWKTLWELPENADLKQARKNPNVLLAGDRVFIPELRSKEETRATEKTHKFVRKGEPSQIKLVFRHGTQPRANQPYVLDIDGKESRGNLGANGEVLLKIPGNARAGRITVGEDKEQFELALGHLDPIETLSGAQARLNNMGYDSGGADGTMTDETHEALRRFQKDQGLESTGELTDQTRAKIKDVHGC